MGQSEYGLYSLTASIVSYLSLLGFGLTAGYIRFYFVALAKHDAGSINRLNGMFLTVLSTIALIAMTGGVTIALNADVIMNHKLSPEELRKAKILTLLLSFNLAATFPAGLTNAFATVHERFVFLKLIQILKTLITPLVIVPILVIGYASIGMGVATVFVNCCAEALIAFYCLKKLKMRFDFSHFDKKLFWKICAFSSYIFLNIIINQVNWNVDKYLIGIFYNTSAVAVYAIASQLAVYYNHFSTAISSVFIPQVNMIVSTSNDNNQLTDLFIKIGRIQLFLILFVCLGFIFFGRPFVIFWAGENYADAYIIILLLIVPVIVPLIQNIGIEIQQAKNMHRFRSVVYTMMAFVNVLISIPLCKHYGAIGAAVGTAISLIVANGLLMNWYYHYRIKIDIYRFWREVIKAFPSFIVPVVVGVLLNYCLNLYKISNFLLGSAVFSAAYFLSVWRWGMNEYEKGLAKPFIARVERLKDRKASVLHDR